MKNGIALWLAVVLALCLGACQTPGAEPSAIPIPSEKATPTSEITPTPALELELNFEPWQEAYVEVMREELEKLDTSEALEGYRLYDIDKDGIPELLFFYEDPQIPETWHIYTYRPYQSKQAIFLGEFFLSHEEWRTYPEGNGLLKYWCQMGVREITLYTLEDNALKETQVFPDIDPKPDDLMEALFPCSKTIPGKGLRTDLQEAEDYSLLLDYPASNVYGTRGENVELSRADFSVYDSVLSPRERETLASLLPVLTGEEPLIPDWNKGEKIFLTEWFEKMLVSETGNLPSVFTAFALCDLDQDGAQELILWTHGYGGCYTILHRENGTVYGTYMATRWFQALQTDGAYFVTGALGNEACYQAYFENGQLMGKELGHTYYDHAESELVHYFVGEKEVSEEEFEAWLDELLVGDVIWYAAREKGEDAAPEPDLSLDPWQKAYLDILLHPEEYEEFYAVAEHIPSNNAEGLKWIIEDNDSYYFAISDLNGDEIPELLLGQGIVYYWTPGVLLNILCWNEEIGVAEDLDGPRAYPLMDTFYFYDTGYFSTMNGAGGLYTEFWHLEDKDPDHYWYGCERSATFNDDGELVTWEEFPFESSDGEKFTLQEYYELLGETGVRIHWQEITEEAVRQAFLPPAREETTP